MLLKRFSRGFEFFVFVVVVLLIAWVPMVVFEPAVPNRAVDALLEGSGGLFGEVEGFSLLVVDEGFKDVVRGNMIGADVLLNDDTVSSYVYWRDDRQVLVVVEKIGSGSDRYLEELFVKNGWVVDLEREWVVDGVRSAGFRAFKDGGFVSLVYWRVSLFKRESKLVFFSKSRGTEVVVIGVATPLDPGSGDRLDSVVDGAVLPVLEKVFV